MCQVLCRVGVQGARGSVTWDKAGEIRARIRQVSQPKGSGKPPGSFEQGRDLGGTE